MPRRTKISLVAVFAVVLILLGFLVFLLAYDDLKRIGWVQGLAGVIMSLIVAVVLFSIVYSAAEVRGAAFLGGVLGISGAALFYVFLLPRIYPFFFPARSVSGYVYFKRNNPGEALQAVANVTARIPATNQHSNPTDETGYFTIADVYVDPTKLDFDYAANTYLVNVSDYPDQHYDIIPRPQIEPTPNQKPLVNVWKKSDWYKCDLRRDEGYTAVEAFSLETDLKKDDGERSSEAKILHVRTTLDSKVGDLTQPRNFSPEKGMNAVQPGDHPGRDHGWLWTDIKDEKAKVKVAICVSRKNGGRKPEANDLTTVYWYGVLK